MNAAKNGTRTARRWKMEELIFALPARAGPRRLRPDRARPQRWSQIFPAEDKTEVFSLARAMGIQTSYLDMAGHWQQASSETLREILRLFGIDGRSPKAVRNALRGRQEQQWREVLPPVALSWNRRAITILLRLPAAAATTRALCRIRFEDGGSQSHDWRLPRS